MQDPKKTAGERSWWVCAYVLGAVALTTAAAAPVGAEGRGDRILRMMDSRLTSATDQFFEYEMVTRIPGKSEIQTVFTVHIKGDSWRRLSFSSPGDIKGMRVLILSLKQMYVYLPAYRKVRRVASHVRDQGFMGSAFSHDDMSVVTYGDKMMAEEVKEKEDHWVVMARRRPESDYRYARLRIKIRKDNYQPEQVDYFNEAGTKIKSDRRTQFECQDRHCNPRIISLTDYVRGGVTSTLTRRAWKINTGVPDSFFTVRSLIRGS